MARPAPVFRLVARAGVAWFLGAVSPAALRAAERVFPDRPDTTVVFAVADTSVLRLDLYLPSVPAASRDLDFSAARGAKPWPLIVWFHGGGWRGGSRSDPCPALPLRAAGYAVASVDYRLSGVARWPAQLQDARAAVRWLRAHGADYTLDTARIAAWGTSAGGHLAALLGTDAGGPEAVSDGDGAAVAASVSAAVRAVVAYHAPSDFLEPHPRRGKRGSSIADLLGCPVAECPERALAASPIYRVAASDPPFFIVHGLADSTVPFTQAVRLDAALRAAGVPVTVELIPGADHGGPAFVSPEMLARVRAFLDHALIR